MAKPFFPVCLLILTLGLARAEDAWFSAELPLNGKIYPVIAKIHSKKAENNIEFSSELHYHTEDTSFSMHTTGVYNTAKEKPVWQNSIRSGLYTVEWTFRDYTETPAAVYWSDNKNHNVSTTTFENDAIPEEFLYFLTEKIDSTKSSKDFKILSPTWEVSFAPNAWAITANYTGFKARLQGVDCYQVIYTRSDGVRAEYYITLKGKQVWRFQTFRGVWFDRVR
jgi:hypothetical protein